MQFHQLRLTRAPANSLPFQSQIANDDETAGTQPLFTAVGVEHYRVWTTPICVQVFIVLFRILVPIKKYVRLNHDVPYSGRLNHGPRSPRPVHSVTELAL